MYTPISFPLSQKHTYITSSSFTAAKTVEKKITPELVSLYYAFLILIHIFFLYLIDYIWCSIWWTNFFLMQTRSPSKAATMFCGTQEKCATCGKTAYPLEKVKYTFIYVYIQWNLCCLLQNYLPSFYLLLCADNCHQFNYITLVKTRKRTSSVAMKEVAWAN